MFNVMINQFRSVEWNRARTAKIYGQGVFLELPKGAASI